MLALVLAAAFVAIPAAPPPVSDPFEVEVYNAETVEAGHFMAEQHANVTSNSGAHLTYEFIYGIVNWLEVATYFATEWKTGSHAFDMAEWRLRVRPRTPDSWPVHASFNIETVWDEHGFASIELRPIWSNAWGRLSLDVAPALEIGQDGTAELQPAAKLSLSLGGGFQVGPEYYGNLGPVDDPAAASRQWHQLFAALDVTRFHHIEINAAVGFGLTAATDGFTVKTIFGYQF